MLARDISAYVPRQRDVAPHPQPMSSTISPTSAAARSSSTPVTGARSASCAWQIREWGHEPRQRHDLARAGSSLHRNCCESASVADEAVLDTLVDTRQIATLRRMMRRVAAE
jgi:hypothetical protein